MQPLWLVVVGLLSVSLGGAAGVRLMSERSQPHALVGQTAPPSAAGLAVLDRDRDPGMVGLLAGKEEVLLTAPFDGRLRAFDLRAGDRVAAGQVVAEVESPSGSTDLDEAQADVEAALAERSRAKRAVVLAREHWQRTERLGKFSSREQRRDSLHELRSRQADQAAAVARLAQRRAAAKRLLDRASDGVIRAPFAGVVAERYPISQDRIGGQAPLVLLVRDGEPIVRFAGEPAEVAGFHIGDRVVVGSASSGERVDGSIISIAAEVDPGAQIVLAEARIETMPPTWRAGLEARVWTHGELSRP